MTKGGEEKLTVLHVVWHHSHDLWGLPRKLCETNVPWGRRRSSLIGLSALCYVLPSLVDASRRRAMLWVLQAALCFWSDYIDTGKFGVSHLLDKMLASALTFYVVAVGLAELGLPLVLLLGAPTFFCLAVSSKRRIDKDFRGYAIYHSLWHLTSSLACAYTLLKTSQ